MRSERAGTRPGTVARARSPKARARPVSIPAASPSLVIRTAPTRAVTPPTRSTSSGFGSTRRTPSATSTSPVATRAAPTGPDEASCAVRVPTATTSPARQVNCWSGRSTRPRHRAPLWTATAMATPRATRLAAGSVNPSRTSTPAARPVAAVEASHRIERRRTRAGSDWSRTATPPAVSRAAVMALTAKRAPTLQSGQKLDSTSPRPATARAPPRYPRASATTGTRRGRATGRAGGWWESQAAWASADAAASYAAMAAAWSPEIRPAPRHRSRWVPRSAGAGGGGSCPPGAWRAAGGPDAGDSLPPPRWWVTA